MKFYDSSPSRLTHSPTNPFGNWLMVIRSVGRTKVGIWVSFQSPACSGQPLIAIEPWGKWHPDEC